jgi:hypothetical protein
MAARPRAALAAKARRMMGSGMGNGGSHRLWPERCDLSCSAGFLETIGQRRWLLLAAAAPLGALPMARLILMADPDQRFNSIVQVDCCGG